MDEAPGFQLCSICSKIPFDLCFSGEESENSHVWEIPSPDEWTEACSLCSFLLKSLPMRYEHLSVMSWLIKNRVQLQCTGQRVRTYLELWTQPLENPDIKTLHLSLSPDSGSSMTFFLDTIVSITSKGQRTLGQPKMVPPLISYATITEWMNRKIPYPEPRNELAENLQSTVPLKVIDCTMRKLIILPEKEPYVTLSYVWGSVDSGKIAPGSGKDEPESLPLQLPSTIEDCITVCLKLGFRYLWVDRYCIYGSHDVRAQQIQQMDNVYSQSALTVIACAGADSTYGLPGVSRPRTPYPSLKFQDLGYLLGAPATKEIENSVWATRGWTFQEALLSKHQLYFTDKQLFLGHNNEIECESDDGLSKAVSKAVPSYQSLGDLTTYECIEDYSERHLSYPVDILNAFLGILSQLQKDRGVLHLWGLPFRGSGYEMTKGQDVSHELVFAESLCWSASKPARREGFPTWSWTHNDGAVYWPLVISRALDDEPSEPESLPKFEVELMSGDLCSLSEYQLRYDELNNYSEGLLSKDRPSRFIHVEAFVSPVINIEADGDKNKVFIRLITGEPITFYIWRSPGSVPVLPGPVLAIHLVNSIRGYSNYVLIVGNMGNHWERIGLIYDHHHLLDHAEKARQKIRLG